MSDETFIQVEVLGVYGHLAPFVVFEGIDAEDGDYVRFYCEPRYALDIAEALDGDDPVYALPPEYMITYRREAAS